MASLRAAALPNPFARRKRFCQGIDFFLSAIQVPFDCSSVRKLVSIGHNLYK